MAHHMHYVMEKWLVQSLDVFTCDLNLCWLVLETYIQSSPRPSANQVRDTVVPMFLAIINDDDEQDSTDLVSSRNSNSWHRYQNAALRKIAEEEIRDDGSYGKRQLTRYRFRDHLRVAIRSTLENLVVFPFWAIKVAAISGGGRVADLRPYPFAIGWYGCFKVLVQEEGYRGLIKGALPMVIIGVSQALVVARQRHVAFMRLVENSVHKSPSKASLTRTASSASLMKTRLRSSQHGRFGSTTTPQASSIRRSGPWDYFTELMRVVVRHPFELLGVRMVTSNAPEYASSFSALWYHFTNSDMSSLFVGIRQTLFNSVFIPKQSQQFMLLGIPTMLRVRRMLALPSNRPNFDAHAGLGGSVKLLVDMLKEDGMIALLSCARVTFDIALPAAVSLLVARAVGRLLVGCTREHRIKMEIRQAYLRERFARAARRDGNMYGVTSSMRNDSDDSFYGNSSTSLNDLASLSRSSSSNKAGRKLPPPDSKNEGGVPPDRELKLNDVNEATEFALPSSSPGGGSSSLKKGGRKNTISKDLASYGTSN